MKIQGAVNGDVPQLIKYKFQTMFIKDKDRKSTRLNSSHGYISYAVFCLKKKNELQSRLHIVCRLLLEQKKTKKIKYLQ